MNAKQCTWLNIITCFSFIYCGYVGSLELQITDMLAQARGMVDKETKCWESRNYVLVSIKG